MMCQKWPLPRDRGRWPDQLCGVLDRRVISFIPFWDRRRRPSHLEVLVGLDEPFLGKSRHAVGRQPLYLTQVFIAPLALPTDNT